MMNPTRDFIEAIDRDRLDRARRLSPEQRWLASFEILEMSLELMKQGIRSQYPDADEACVLDTLRDRLEIARQLETRT